MSKIKALVTCHPPAGHGQHFRGGRAWSKGETYAELSEKEFEALTTPPGSAHFTVLKVSDETFALNQARIQLTAEQRIAQLEQAVSNLGDAVEVLRSELSRLIGLTGEAPRESLSKLASVVTPVKLDSEAASKDESFVPTPEDQLPDVPNPADLASKPATKKNSK